MAYILLGALLLLVVIVISYYNKLVKARNIVQEGISGIDVQLKKRFELVPNLIEAIKGYNKHEAELLSDLVAKRIASGNTTNEMATNDQAVTNALKNVRVQVEAYPELKANDQFSALMRELSKIEEELAMARRYYNGTTRDNNTLIESFPAVIFAKSFGFSPYDFYEISSHEKATPTVELQA